MTSTQNENADQVGPALKCHRYGVYHFSRCPIKCNKCGKFGQKAKDYRGKVVATVANTQPILVYYEYGEMGHVRNRCPKRNNWPSGNAHGQAYVIKDAEQKQGPNVVTCTFLVNNRYVIVLFDSEADKSFVNTSFSHLVDINPVRLYTSYEVELAHGKIVSTNTVLRDCTLNLVNHLFEIDLIPIKLGTFDVIIGMDWLVKRDAVIVCGKKVVHIPVKNKTLVVEGDIVTEKEPAEISLKDVPVIRDFPEVFPDDLPGLTPPRVRVCIQRLICDQVIINSVLGKRTFQSLLSGPVQEERKTWRTFEDYLRAAKEGEIYEWGKDEEEVFQLLKQKLCYAPIMALLEGRRIAYASQQLRTQEENYTTHDLDLGAVVFSLKLWRHCLYGTKCTMYTDHKSLQYILDQKELNMRQRWWIELLRDYDCEIRSGWCPESKGKG
ncbi:putative reverse transcriptase domain-containing protein [Tanacetum coccineum]